MYIYINITTKKNISNNNYDNNNKALYQHTK